MELRNKNNKKKKNTKKKKNDVRQFWSNILTTFFIFVVMITVFSMISDSNSEENEIPISQLALDIKGELVELVLVKGNELEITYLDETEKISKKEEGTALSETLTNYGVSFEELNSVSINIEKEGGFRFWLLALMPIIAPIVFIVILIWFLSRQVKGAGMQAFTFGQSKARMIDPNDKSKKVTFKDVAGALEAKEELTEIVDFLKNPKKFIDIGARIPKGIILMGAPGTGKTLLARAVAGEAGVPFFTISGSEFVEMFVGVGASRVRDLFKTAKANAPSIIFVDEIDAVGRVRGSGVGGGNDEREQTLNQILVEMDGFEQNEKVIVMAATNRPDVLDPALLRPGRFDRRVTIDLPDRKDRKGILEIHVKGKPLTEDVNLEVIAERTPGFSGADIYSLVNEGAILAARENRKKVSQHDFIRSIEKVILGPERKSHLLGRKEKEITAYHEAGHALVSSVLPYADPVHKVSVIARGRAAGYTMHLPFDDKKMQSKKEFLDDIAVSMAGYVTEQIVFGDVTTGPSNDLQVLTSLAHDMVTRYGMSEKIGRMTVCDDPGTTIGGQTLRNRGVSEKMSADVDSEVNRIVEEGYKRAEDIIKKHRKVLDAIAQKLVEVETLEREEFEKLLILNGITPKKKEDIEHSE